MAWAGSTYLADQYRATDTPPVHGDDLSRIVAGTLRQDMAETVAAQWGWPTPAPGQMSETLDRAFPAAGDPFDAMLNPGRHRALQQRPRGHPLG